MDPLSPLPGVVAQEVEHAEPSGWWILAVCLSAAAPRSVGRLVLLAQRQLSRGQEACCISGS